MDDNTFFDIRFLKSEPYSVDLKIQSEHSALFLDANTLVIIATEID